MSNLVVQTNVLALNSHRNLKVVGGKQFTASARLASGYRINSAADDAAGLAISEKMRAQIRGLDMASKNTQDGISLVQTAEGGMQEIDNMIQRIRELVVQAANDTNDYQSADRRKIQEEIDQLTKGIDKMAGQVEFNAKKLLDGSLVDGETKATALALIDTRLLQNSGNTSGSIYLNSGAIGTVIGSLSSWTASVANSTYTLNAGMSNSYTVAVAQVTSLATLVTGNINTFDNADAKMKLLDTYIAAMKVHADFGNVDAANAITNALKQKDAIMQAASISTVVAADFTARGVVDGQAGQGLWFQTGSNSGQGISVGIGSIKTNLLGIGDGQGVSTIKVNQASGQAISADIDRVNSALQYVTAERARLGAVQNRLEYTKSSLDISSENLSASESRIRDADMAKEMMRLTAANVLQQAGVSMLAQANQAPQSVLQLLR